MERHARFPQEVEAAQMEMFARTVHTRAGAVARRRVINNPIGHKNLRRVVQPKRYQRALNAYWEKQRSKKR